MTAAALKHSERMVLNAHPEHRFARYKREARVVALEAAAVCGCRPEAIFNSSDHRREVVQARRMVIHTLKAKGYSNGRVAKSLGLDTSTVFYALQRAARIELRVDLGPIPVPDESGVWAI